MIRGECHIGDKPSNHQHKMLGIEHSSYKVNRLKTDKMSLVAGGSALDFHLTRPRR